MNKRNKLIEFVSLGDYENIVRYDVQVPSLLDFGDLTSNEEKIVFAILGAIRDRTPDGYYKFSYYDLANLAGITKINNSGVIIPRLGKYFERIIDKLVPKLMAVHLILPISYDEQGKPEYYKSYPLFERQFEVNHREKTLALYVNTAQFRDEIIDQEGNVEQTSKRIIDLFNKKNWGVKNDSDTFYINFGRDLHNLLNSKYSQRLYRFLSQYRNIGMASIASEDFETGVLELLTVSKRNRKYEILKLAMSELSSLYYVDENKQEDNKGPYIIPDLKVNIEKKGKDTVGYRFSFTPFKVDLNKIATKENSKVKFDIKNQKFIRDKDENTDFVMVMSFFKKTFSTRESYNKDYDNKRNRNFIKECLKKMDKEVIIDALSKVGNDRSKTFGYVKTILEKRIEGKVIHVEDIEKHEEYLFKKNTDSLIQFADLPTKYKKLPLTENQRERLLCLLNSNVPDFSVKVVFTNKQKTIVRRFEELLEASNISSIEKSEYHTLYDEILTWGDLNLYEYSNIHFEGILYTRESFKAFIAQSKKLLDKR